MTPAETSIWGISLLLLSSIFETLLNSYTITGEAGIGRLTEKFPQRKVKWDYWEPRWLRLHATLLTLAVVTKTLAITTFALSAIALYPENKIISISVVIAFLLSFIIFLKLLPKVLSEHFADKFTASSLNAVALLTQLLFFISIPIAQLEKLLMTRADASSDDEDSPSVEDEILSLVEQSDDEELEEEELDIIRNVFEFGETVTREIMTPRVDIVALENELSIDQAIREAKDSAHSRFPVFHDTIDDILGNIHVKELMRHLSEGHGDKLINELIKSKPIFIPESMPINDLLQLLKKQQSQIAFVVDEYGGTAGLVTIEDILEELVGEIEDEFDEQEDKVTKLSDGSIVVDARLPIDDVNEILAIEIPESEEYDSIGGYIFHELGRIPVNGELYKGADHEITIKSATPRQLQKLRVAKTSNKPN